MPAWKGKWISNHTFRQDQLHHQRQQRSISLGKILMLSMSQDSLPFCLSWSFHFHYLEKYKFPIASGDDTVISANSRLQKQSLVTNCSKLHRDSLTETPPPNRHFLHFSCYLVWHWSNSIALLSSALSTGLPSVSLALHLKYRLFG